jgi:hypothetical protein
MPVKTDQVQLDPRLGRVPFFDEQSRDYPVRALIDARRPRSYTWRCLDWHDQGEEGACVYFGIGHELAARPLEIRGLTEKYLRDGYHRAQHLDPWAGCHLGRRCPVEPGPAYEGTAVLAGLKIAREDGHIGEFRWAFGIEDLVMALGRVGPAVLGVWWHRGMFEPDANGFIWPTGGKAGGHAICARGVRLIRIDRRKGFSWDNIDFDKSYVILRNSWGKPWGRNGDCYITLTALSSLLKDAGEAAIITERLRAK